MRDDVSRNTAGKKETVTRGQEKVQKRYLLDSLKNLFKAFKAVNPGVKCSYFNFTKHRPFYILRPTINGRDMCLCKTHTNAEYKFKALRRKGVINAIDTGALIMETVCNSYQKDCMYGVCVQCHDKEIKTNSENVKGKIQWLEWVREEEIYFKEGKRIKTIKNVKKLIEDTIQDMLENFKGDLKTLKKHIFNMKTQNKNFRQSIDEIRPNEAVILVDFSENYNAKCSEEIQAHHFGGSRNQITLHTVVAYVYDSDEKHKVLPFCTISPCNIHQPAAIWAHLDPILKHLIENYGDIDTIHYFSDGPFSQYRQKANFYLACTKTFNYGFQAFSWSFFEAGHGKGPADGIGGYLKREADKKVATGNDIIDAFGFYTILQESSKIKLFYITKENIDNVQRCIPNDLIPLPGTKDVHQIFSRIRGQVMHRNLSCFCSRAFCECLHPKMYLPSQAARNASSSVNTCEDIPEIDNVVLNPLIPLNLNLCEDVSSDDDVPLINLKSSKQGDFSYTNLHDTRRASIYKRVYGEDSDGETNTTHPSVSGQNCELPGIGDSSVDKNASTFLTESMNDKKEGKENKAKAMKVKRKAILDNKEKKIVPKKKIKRNFNKNNINEYTTEEETGIMPEPSNDKSAMDEVYEDDEDFSVIRGNFGKLTRRPAEDDYVLVMFIAKNLKVYYVGKIIEIEGNDCYGVSFMRLLNKANMKFRMPLEPDLASVELKEIKMILPAPKINGTGRRNSTFCFPVRVAPTINLR